MDLEPTAFFTALGHDTRLRCLALLIQHDELCVCELTQALGLSQPHMSRHLAPLRELGLVSDRRVGTWIHYRINPDLPEWAHLVLQQTVRGLGQIPPFVDDAQALADRPLGPGSTRCAE